MKKHAGRRKASPVEPQGGQDLGSMIGRIQQQLTFLEKKIDTLIAQSQARPSGEKSFQKPFQRFDRPRQFEGRPDIPPRERTLYKAICADCKNPCEVPFKPSQDRPVYCRDCFAKRKNAGPFKARPDDKAGEAPAIQTYHADSGHADKIHKTGKKKRTVPKRRKK